MPDNNGFDDGGLLTQACQTNSLRDLNVNRNVKKAKKTYRLNTGPKNFKSLITNILLFIRKNHVDNRSLINGILSDMNELNYFSNDIFVNVENESPKKEEVSGDSGPEPIPQSASPPSEKQSTFCQSPLFKVNRLDQADRTSTPRMSSNNLVKKRILVDDKNPNHPLIRSRLAAELLPTQPDVDLKQPQSSISDDSLLIALTQFEKTENPTKKSHVERKIDVKTSAATTVNPVKPVNKRTVNEFVRYRSDPLNNNSVNNQQYSSQFGLQTAYEDDDDEVNLLFHDENLLKLIDSKTTTASKQSNNLQMRGKAPSLPQLNQKMIQVPSRSGLKIQRMTSSDSLHQQQSNIVNQTSVVKSKNFYGQQQHPLHTKPDLPPLPKQQDQHQQSQTKSQIHKYTQEQIELKRQQAMLRLQQKLKNK